MAHILMNNSQSTPKGSRLPSTNVPSFMQESFLDSVVPQNKSEVRKSREKKGLCPTCGLTATHCKKLLRLEPLTIEGEVLEGWCLTCNTLDSVLAQPGVLEKMEKKKKKNKKRNIRTRDVASMRNLNVLSKSSDSTLTSLSHSLPENGLDALTSQFHQLTGDLPGVPGEPSEVESILEQMKNNPYSSQIQSRGCLDLFDLYEEEKGDLFEVIDAVTNAMEKHVTNIEVQGRGCLAFRRLSMTHQHSASEEPEINADNCAKMEVEGAIHSVINAMNYYHNSEHVQKEAMHFIRNCLQATGSSKGIVLGRNGIEVIVRAMWKLETFSTAQEHGCTILWCLAISNPEAQFSIMSNEGIGAILNGMSKHLSSEKVQYCACGALQTLSSSKSEIQQNMLEIGAFDAIFNSMSEHKYSKSVAEAASTAAKNLMNLASESSLYASVCKISDRHVQVITRVMRANEGEVRIQKCFCQLLEKAAQSDLNIETLRRNETRDAFQESAASYPDECLESVINIVSIIDA